MNKIVLLFLLIGITYKVSAQSVCTPDSSKFPKGTTFGIYPDSLNAEATVAYSQTLQFKFPKDSSYSSFPVVIDSVRIDSVSHFPKSFGYQCGAKNCTYIGGTYGCANITGSPSTSQVGIYHLVIHFTVFVHSSLISSELPIPDTGSMKLTINAHSSIFDQAINSKFELNQNYPNPFNRTTEIAFNSPATQVAGLLVRNELGQIVYSKQMECIQGANLVQFDRNGLPQGIYLYSIQAGENTITRRMVIKD